MKRSFFYHIFLTMLVSAFFFACNDKSDIGCQTDNYKDETEINNNNLTNKELTKQINLVNKLTEKEKSLNNEMNKLQEKEKTLNNEMSIIEYLKLDKKINYKFPYELLVDELLNITRKGLYNKSYHKKIREIAYKVLKYNVNIRSFYYYLCSKILKENLLDRDIIKIIHILNTSYYNYMRSYRKILILECLFFNLFKFYNLKLMNIVDK